MNETELIEIVVLQNIIASKSNCTKCRCLPRVPHGYSLVFKPYVQFLSKSLFKALARYEQFTRLPSASHPLKQGSHRV